MKVKYYIIAYTAVFKYGYVKLWFFKKPQPNAGASPETASKFRFKIFANLTCWILNKESDIQCNLMTFKVVPKF